MTFKKIDIIPNKVVFTPGENGSHVTFLDQNKNKVMIQKNITKYIDEEYVVVYEDLNLKRSATAEEKAFYKSCSEYVEIYQDCMMWKDKILNDRFLGTVDKANYERYIEEGLLKRIKIAPEVEELLERTLTN